MERDAQEALMNPLMLVFLAIIALCALVQAAFFTALAVASRKAAARVDAWAARTEGELKDMGRRVEDLTARLESLSRQAHEVLERSEPVVENLATRAERAGEAMRHAADLPFVPLRNG